MTYITIVGLRYYFGNEVFRVGQRLLIEKDIDNEEDGSHSRNIRCRCDVWLCREQCENRRKRL